MLHVPACNCEYWPSDERNYSLDVTLTVRAEILCFLYNDVKAKLTRMTFTPSSLLVAKVSKLIYAIVIRSHVCMKLLTRMLIN